jgi:hypothetical protein
MSTGTFGKIFDQQDMRLYELVKTLHMPQTCLSVARVLSMNSAQIVSLPLAERECAY